MGAAYQARIDAQDQVFLALLAFCRDGVGEDGNPAAFGTGLSGLLSVKLDLTLPLGA